VSHTELVAMTDRDLKHYIRQHPEDHVAFHLYMDRRHARTEDIEVIEPDDPQWGEKFMAMIQKQMAQAENP
jgi:pyridoxine 5'-phosphate synthase PdxJ